ncbi:MAG: NADPH:quinone reductase-like Zn-dependent oxidoreductase [Crocinitomicaceae bacterium]|jgi:NADPH:quinone reductase-like Zn-dependent oxidoreductase
MKSVIVNSYGGPEVLNVENVDKPTPKENEILIQIKATSITAASTFMREGKPYIGRLFIGLRKPKTKTPGTDLSGVIEAVGKNVTKFKVGDSVMAETGLTCGAYAEYICLGEDELIVHHPDNVSAEEATGIIDGACTAMGFFTDSARITQGQEVLINGASGSIGTAAIQLAKLSGARVTAVCSGKNKALVLDLGADAFVDYTTTDLEKIQNKFDVIFDTVGKMSFRKGKKLLTNKGVFLTPVLSFSALLNMMFVSPFASKKLKFSATGMRKHDLRMRDLLNLRELLQSGKITPVIDHIYNLDQIQEAHAYVDQGHKRGNVVVSFQN